MTFSSADLSHQHSLQTLEELYQFDDFMMSVRTLADMGCGKGNDIEWWATRTTRDEHKKLLNIKCTGVDTTEKLLVANEYPNISYQRQDFEDPFKRKFDVIWCHDAFQYAINPLITLKNWNKALTSDGMLVIILPQQTVMEFRRQAFDQPHGVYYNWTLISLIHALAVNGFDCAGGFFKKERDDPWLHAIVYKSEVKPMDPRTTTWYDLAEAGLLPSTLCSGVEKYAKARQRDLILPWLGGSLISYSDY